MTEQKMVNILIVDDEESSVDLLQMLLRKRYPSVQKACSGAAALEIIKNSPVEIILTDINMPIMSGIELCEKAKEQHSEVKVFAMTAFCAEDIDQQIAAANFDGTIRKPIQRKALFELLENAISS